MNQIQNYLEETEKEFEEKFSELNKMVYPKGNIYNTFGKELKSFLHERQLGLIELIKGLVPKKQREYSFDNQYFPECRGFNSCREQFLKNLELKDN